MTPSKLRKMIVVLPKQYVVLQGHLIAKYRKLEYLEIEDVLSMYSCDATLPNRRNLAWSVERADALAYKSIKLQGWSALCFQPKILYFTPNLRILHLGAKLINGQSYIPPVEEILRHEFDSKDQETAEFKARADARRRGEYVISGQTKRPYWPWDWNLPNLQTLHLTGEFTWRFKFKMLAGCPNLENFILNMTIIGDNNSVTKPEDRQDGDQSELQQDSQRSNINAIFKLEIFYCQPVVMKTATRRSICRLRSSNLCTFEAVGSSRMKLFRSCSYL
ncbi:hypothetical protein BGX26_003965 [Mortierella sp. AD094]|nr:hypothetical protein BGX26_003965 [Mortierella sp. AD094]